PSGYNDTGAQCTKKTYGRGKGKPIHVCPDGYEQSGAICYPHCAPGYYGAGPVCWQECPSGFTDNGAFCLKPKPYGRGTGYISQSRCENAEGTACEEWG